MAKKNIQNVQATEEIVVAAVETVEAIEAAPEYPKEMLLFTASRGKATFLNWAALTIEEDDPLVKVKGCAIEIPERVAEVIGKDKFVSYIDLAIIRQCVEEGKAVRGTASTVSDVYNRYTKVTGERGERVAVALDVFGQVIEAIDAGTLTGGWINPEAEAPAPEAEAEASGASAGEAEVDDPFAVEEG